MTRGRMACKGPRTLNSCRTDSLWSSIPEGCIGPVAGASAETGTECGVGKVMI